jgi:hypothetical protein
MKCYLVVEAVIYEGYYFNHSKVFTNWSNAINYIKTINQEGSFDIIELDLIN